MCSYVHGSCCSTEILCFYLFSPKKTYTNKKHQTNHKKIICKALFVSDAADFALYQGLVTFYQYAAHIVPKMSEQINVVTTEHTVYRALKEAQPCFHKLQQEFTFLRQIGFKIEFYCVSSNLSYGL